MSRLSKIVFEASINTRPFQSYLDEMKGLVDSFFEKAKENTDDFSEKLGGLKLPKLDFPAFDTEGLVAFTYSIEGLKDGFCALKEMLNKTSSALSDMNISDQIGSQFDETIISAENLSGSFDIIKQSFSDMLTNFKSADISANIASPFEEVEKNVSATTSAFGFALDTIKSFNNATKPLKELVEIVDKLTNYTELKEIAKRTLKLAKDGVNKA